MRLEEKHDCEIKQKWLLQIIYLNYKETLIMNDWSLKGTNYTKLKTSCVAELLKGKSNLLRKIYATNLLTISTLGIQSEP